MLTLVIEPDRAVTVDTQRRSLPNCLLVGAENFGCGSSREHAVRGLLQYGIRVIVAPGFGEIFYSNAMINQLLLVIGPTVCAGGAIMCIE
jgi:3-isopropylmalate dehydratase small subunit